MQNNQTAAAFRAAIIKKLAKIRPDLCNSSGLGFWPVPIMIPVIIAKCIYLLHAEWQRQIMLGDRPLAKKLSEIRILLAKLGYEGDLGEDHAGIYMKEHPEVKNVEMETLPFFK